MFTAAAAYNITYAPYVSDYSRYLPKSTRTGPIVASVFFGAAGSAVWLIALGAWLATNLGATDALVALRDAGDQVRGIGSDLVYQKKSEVLAHFFEAVEHFIAQLFSGGMGRFGGDVFQGGGIKKDAFGQGDEHERQAMCQESFRGQEYAA